MAEQIDIPAAWERLDISGLDGLLMLVGETDTGKSTFARYLYRRLAAEGQPVAFLDGDPGQSRLGPPATLTVAIGGEGETAFPPQGRRWRSFIGATSPRGHMLPLVVGAARLVEAARLAGAKWIVYDTCGLVDPNQGGLALKLAEIDLLRPAAVLALQWERELEPLLIPLRQSRRTRLIELKPSPAVKPRSQAARQAHRAAQFAAYFARAGNLDLIWTRYAVLPELRFTSGRLVALEDRESFTRGLGIVQRFDTRKRQVTLRTPLKSADEIDALRLGDIILDLKTFQESR